jgi:hypothetical protein
MKNVCIVGAGFAAWCAKKIVPDGFVISPSALERRIFESDIRRKALEVNKLMQHRSKSFGGLKFDLTKCVMHDRIVHGGNSEVWGGFIRKVEDPLSLRLFAESNLVLRPLRMCQNGYMSNDGSIHQLVTSEGRIFSARSELNIDFDAVVTRISKSKDAFDVFCSYVDQSRSTSDVVIKAERVVLCVGVVQLIDLLFRSDLIGSGTRFSLDEFEYSLGVYGRMCDPIRENSGSSIYYSFSRAFEHLLGFQRRFCAFPSSSLGGVVVRQTFFDRTLRMEAIICGNTVKCYTNADSFGKSIHYNNLMIDSQPVNEFIRDFFGPNLLVFGMAAIRQQFPGPISNDILADAIQRLSW